MKISHNQSHNHLKSFESISYQDHYKEKIHHSEELVTAKKVDKVNINAYLSVSRDFESSDDHIDTYKNKIEEEE